jgi:hypothetical protein
MLAAVVEIVSVVVPPVATVAELKEQELSLGSPVQLAEKVTDELKPLVPFTVITVLALAPGEVTVTAAGAKVTPKSGPGLTTTETEPDDVA